MSEEYGYDYNFSDEEDEEDDENEILDEDEEEIEDPLFADTYDEEDEEDEDDDEDDNSLFGVQSKRTNIAVKDQIIDKKTFIEEGFQQPNKPAERPRPVVQKQTNSTLIGTKLPTTKARVTDRKPIKFTRTARENEKTYNLRQRIIERLMSRNIVAYEAELRADLIVKVIFNGTKPDINTRKDLISSLGGTY